MLPNAPLHIIDHGSLVYLVLLQIRFYDQQDFLPLTTPYESSADTNDIQHDTLIYNNPSLFNNNNNNNDNYYGNIPVSNSFIVTLKTYNTVYNLYFVTIFDGCTSGNDFDLYFDTVLDASSLNSNDNDNDDFGHTDNTMIYTIYDDDSSAINDAPFTVMMTAQVHSSQLLKDIAITNGTTDHIALHTITAAVIASTVGDNNNNATDAAIFISFINSPLHIIDHGSLVYLILLQLPF